MNLVRTGMLARWALRLCLTSLLLLPGCGESTDPVIDYRVEGNVSNVEGPLPRIGVTLTRVNLPEPQIYEASVSTDATGAFTAWVPEGEYEVAINLHRRVVYWSPNGLRPLRGQAGTVSVRPGSHLNHLECRLGGFHLNITTGPEREGTELEWRLRTPVLDDPVLISASRVENGVAVLEGRDIPPGEYRLFLRDGLRDPRFSQREGADIAVSEVGGFGTSPFVEIGLDAYTEYVYDLPAPAEVTFQVESDLAVSELTGVHLLLFDANLDTEAPPFLETSGTLNESGRITLPVAFPRALRTQVSWLLADGVPGTSVTRWIDSNTRSGAFVIQVTPSEQPEDIVTSGHTLELTLGLPSWAGDPMPARVDVFGNDGAIVVGLEVVFSPESGRVRIANLLPGEYRLRLSKVDERLVTQWYREADPVAESIEAATPVAIPASGPVTTLEWSPALGAAFSGRVRRTDGTPVANAFVFLTSDVGRSAVGDLGRTNDEGLFLGHGFGRGRYKLGVYESGSTHWYPDVADWDSAAVIFADDLHDYFEDIDVILR